MKIDNDYLLKTLQELIRIPSINPQLVPDGGGEAAIAAYIASEMEQLGLETRLFEPLPGRVSALGVLKGSGGGRALMLNGHSDTVGVSGMVDPFSGELRDGRVYGRGAQDMKGSLAATLAAVKALQDRRVKLAGDLMVAAVADEEYGSIGTADLLDQLRIANISLDGAIVSEPTDLVVAAAHRGYAWLEVETFGKPAHGSRWWEGIDANRMMARVLVELDDLANELTRRAPHPLVGPPSLHTPLIQGGSEMSIYAGQCRLQIERRTVPGETSAEILAEIQARLDSLAARAGGEKGSQEHKQGPTDRDRDRAEGEQDQVVPFQGMARLWFERPAFEARPGSDLLPVLLEHCKRAGGQDEPGGVAFWTDAALLSEEGIDSLLIGPRGGGLHTPEEWVELDSCVQLADILAETAVEYCGKRRLQ